MIKHVQGLWPVEDFVSVGGELSLILQRSPPQYELDLLYVHVAHFKLKELCLSHFSEQVCNQVTPALLTEG